MVVGKKTAAAAAEATAVRCARERLAGSWDDVKHASMTGLLTQGEFARVRDAVKPPTS